MIVNRNEFKKFWEKAKKFPHLTFCNENYFLISLEDLNNKYIINYLNFIEKNKLNTTDNWDCSKFAMSFKLCSDILHKDSNNDSHLAIGIAHIALKDQKFDHAANMIIYKDKDSIDYIFYDPQNKMLLDKKKSFKGLTFLYF